MKRIARQRMWSVNCLYERVEEELSCGSLFQFKININYRINKISSIRLGFPSWHITFKLGVRQQCLNLRWLKLWWMASILDTFRELEKMKNSARRSAAISFRSWLLWWHLHILVTLDIIKRLTWGCTWWQMRSGRCSWSRVKGQLKIVSGRWFGKHPVHH